VSAPIAVPTTSSIFQYPPNFPNGQTADIWNAYFQSINDGFSTAPGILGAVAYTILADTVSASNGAGLVGYNAALTYGVGTIGKAVKDNAATASAATSLVRTDLADTTDVAKGDALVGVKQLFTGAVARTQHDKNADIVSLKDFGAVGNGIADDTAAMTAAIAAGEFLVPDGTYLVSTVTVNNSVRMYGTGRNKAIIKQKNATNNNLFQVNGDYAFEAYDIQFDGNGANQSLKSGLQDGISIPVGSLTLERCWLHDFKGNIVRSGNTESSFGYASDINTYAHDFRIVGNKFDQGAIGLGYGDCLRLFKVQRGEISGNYLVGGLSPMRGCYYCSGLNIANNRSYNTNDVGITLALSFDCTVVGNVCNGHSHHGIEIDSCVRVTCAGNTTSGNTLHGIAMTEFGPPVGAGYSGYLDGVLVSNPTTPANVDCVFTGNNVSKNGTGGMSLLSCDGVLVSGNRFSGNNTSNTGGEGCGIYLSGGAANKDNAMIQANVFNNTGYQTNSVNRSNQQISYQTRMQGNSHIGGNLQNASIPLVGGFNMMTDRFLLNSASISGTSALVADAQSKTGWARQIADASGASSTVVNYIVNPVSRYGAKLLYFRVRTPDTMTSITVDVNLYLAGVYVATASTIPMTLTTAWSEQVIYLPASLSSNNYDNIHIQFTTSSALTGNVNVEEISCFLPCE
jgi:parallel beta-helix repeat protein